MKQRCGFHPHEPRCQDILDDLHGIRTGIFGKDIYCRGKKKHEGAWGLVVSTRWGLQSTKKIRFNIVKSTALRHWRGEKTHPCPGVTEHIPLSVNTT